MKTITDESGWKISFDDSPEMHKAVFDKLMQDFFLKHGAYNGESISQSDGPQIDASIVLSDLADDIIKFQVDYQD